MNNLNNMFNNKQEENEYGFTLYRMYDISGRSRLVRDDLERGFAADKFTLKLYLDIIRQEQPISIEDLSKRVAPLYGGGKITQGFISSVKGIVRRQLRNEVIIYRDEFVCCSDYSKVHVRFRTEDGYHARGIKSICHEEIMQALKEVIKYRLASEEFILKETSRALGFQKKGAAIQKRLDEALKCMVKRGDIKIDYVVRSNVPASFRYRMGDYSKDGRSTFTPQGLKAENKITNITSNENSSEEVAKCGAGVVKSSTEEPKFSIFERAEIALGYIFIKPSKSNIQYSEYSISRSQFRKLRKLGLICKFQFPGKRIVSVSGKVLLDNVRLHGKERRFTIKIYHASRLIEIEVNGKCRIIGKVEEDSEYNEAVTSENEKKEIGKEDKILKSSQSNACESQNIAGEDTRLNKGEVKMTSELEEFIMSFLW